MPRAGLDHAAVVRIAIAVVDDGGLRGFDDLSLAAVAARAGVAPPSLYKHVTSLAALRRDVGLVAIDELTRVVAEAAAGRSGADAVAAIARATRAYAHTHPGRYAASQAAPDPNDPADAARGEAASRTLALVFAALQGFDIDEARLVDAARSLRASLHGFIALELARGFRLPRDLDSSFETHIVAIVAGLRSLA